MPKASPPQRGVYEVSAEHVGALECAGLLPRLPARVTTHDVYGERPTEADRAGMRWFVTGDIHRPSGVMALRPRFHFAWMRRTLEIEHIAGSRFGVGRLLREAQNIAREAGVPLSGETALGNIEMLQFAAKAGFRRDRMRMTWP